MPWRLTRSINSVVWSFYEVLKGARRVKFPWKSILGIKVA
jgi:hypothetical protein